MESNSSGNDSRSVQLTGAHFALHLLVVALHAAAVELDLDPAVRVFLDGL
jgi:hypothetical protein